MNQPDQEAIGVLVAVAIPPIQYRPSEEAWEQDVLNAVSAAVYAEKTIDTLDVKLLEYEDCQLVFEGGIPIAGIRRNGVSGRIVACRGTVEWLGNCRRFGDRRLGNAKHFALS